MVSRNPCCFLEFSDSEKDEDTDETMKLATDNTDPEVAKDSDAQFHVQMISSILEITDETLTSSDPNIKRPTESGTSEKCLLLPISRQDSEVLRTSKAANHRCEANVHRDGGTRSPTDTGNSSQSSQEVTEDELSDQISEK